MVSNLRSKLFGHFTKLLYDMDRLKSNPVFLSAFIERSKAILGDRFTLRDANMQLQEQLISAKQAAISLEKSQTIVFPAEQADVFLQTDPGYANRLDYRLPFSYTMLQFTKPVTVPLLNSEISNEITQDQLSVLLLYQAEVNEQFWATLDYGEQYRQESGLTLLGIPDALRRAKGGMANSLIAIWQDLNISRFSWVSDDQYELACDAPRNEVEQKIQASWAGIKRLAIACIGYINCENVYLHQEDNVSAAVNAKRERKGKSKLEPYYVCRLRGVQYNSDGSEQGTGTAHGIRYDVRGHFRHLASGKTTWVRPHQRGLQNELYVPKTYLVAKQNAPAA